MTKEKTEHEIKKIHNRLFELKDRIDILEKKKSPEIKLETIEVIKGFNKQKEAILEKLYMCSFFQVIKAKEILDDIDNKIQDLLKE